MWSKAFWYVLDKVFIAFLVGLALFHLEQYIAVKRQKDLEFHELRKVGNQLNMMALSLGNVTRDTADVLPYKIIPVEVDYSTYSFGTSQKLAYFYLKALRARDLYLNAISAINARNTMLHESIPFENRNATFFNRDVLGVVKENKEKFLFVKMVERKSQWALENLCKQIAALRELSVEAHSQKSTLLGNCASWFPEQTVPTTKTDAPHHTKTRE